MYCVFCRIVEDESIAEIVQRWPETIAFVPLKPVTAGHLLVVPCAHVPDAREDPIVTATTMARAAEMADAVGDDCNLITSVGEYATQTVFHLHIHVVPRRPGDGLLLPWSEVPS